MATSKTPAELGNELFAALVGGAESLWNAACEYIGENADPGDVFDNDKLEAWARARGFNLPEE